MNDPLTMLSNLVPEKYRGWLLFLIALVPLLGRAWHALSSGGGLKGIWSALVFGTNTPSKPTSVAASVMNGTGGQGGFALVKLQFLMFLCTVVALWLVGCVQLQPGADPIVVRVEQTETVAKSSFDLVLNVDNSNRPFFATNAPPFHRFCEWLREPQTVEQTNTLPRAAAMLVSLDDVKLAYKNASVGSNDVLTALATVQSAMSQANAWLTVVTNQPATH
ncbi:MAG TPA: hypothetical protein VHC44_14280 [Verrucomicrobiae bacterium]|nr:hypothetical protein [Verrucomicrobiae bacterium]